METSMSKQFYGKYGPGRNANNAPFPKREVSITLTGEEWVTVLARILGKEMSLKGAKVYRKAADKLNKQLLEASRD
jgi:hypothetical protein